MAPTTIRAAYWPSYGAFPASSVNTSLFTHIYYAFLQPDPATFKLIKTSDDIAKLPVFIDSLRRKNPPVKTLLSIGGYLDTKEKEKVFSNMARTEPNRQALITSSIEIAREYGFDGVDLDWEFPSDKEDMSNLALLYKQWAETLDQEAKESNKPRLLLTSAVYYTSEVFFGDDPPRSYPADAISKYVDWVNPMTYDYHGAWENFTEHAALNDPNSTKSTVYGITSWIKAGVPAKKLVMGLPLYGKTWTLKDPQVHGIGAPAVPVRGEMIYREIARTNAESNARVVYDPQYVAHYSYSGSTWRGYDDVESIKKKVQYAMNQSLGGYFFWALGQDKEDWTLSKQGKAQLNKTLILFII